MSPASSFDKLRTRPKFTSFHSAATSFPAFA